MQECWANDGAVVGCIWCCSIWFGFFCRYGSCLRLIPRSKLHLFLLLSQHLARSVLSFVFISCNLDLRRTEYPSVGGTYSCSWICVRRMHPLDSESVY